MEWHDRYLGQRSSAGRRDLKERGTVVIDDFIQHAAQSKWRAVSNPSVPGAGRNRDLEDKYVPG